MPFKLKLKKSRQYNVSSKNLFVVTVELLDNTTVECTLSAHSLGQECLNNVCQRLGLHQPRYFGLRFISKKGTFWWLELQRPLKKQMDKYAQESATLYLGVMYFVSDVNMLQDEVTRYHYFLQLKSDILQGKLLCSEEQIILFASYSLQAEFGDHDPERHTTEYLTNFGLLPKHMAHSKGHVESILEKVIRIHQTLQGMSQPLAEVYYIRETQCLEGYGQECFTGKDSTGISVLVCSSLKGIVVRFMNDQQCYRYLWDQIVNLVHQKRCFSIECMDNPKGIQIFLDDAHVAKYVWKTCIQQHQFYSRNEEVAKSDENPTVLSTASVMNPLFSPNEAVEELSAEQQMAGSSNASRLHFQESQESLEGLGVYHTDGAYSERLPPVTYSPSEASGIPSQHPNPLSSTLTSSTPALQATQPLPQAAIRISSSAMQLHGNEPVFYQINQSRGSMENASKSLMLPTYRQAPDYDTAVKLKYGMQSLSACDMSSSSPMMQSQSSAQSCSPLDAFHVLPIQQSVQLQSYAQYKNYNDLSHLDMGEAKPDRSELMTSRHYENLPLTCIAPPVHTYSSPELAPRNVVNDVPQEPVTSDVQYMYQFKPPPPYPYKQSSSTPDLTKNHVQSAVNSSPNAVSVKDLLLTNTYNNYQVSSNLDTRQVEASSEHPNFFNSAAYVPPPLHTYQNYNPQPISAVDSTSCRVTEPAFSTIMTAQSTMVSCQMPQSATVPKPAETKRNPVMGPHYERAPCRKPANLALNQDSAAMGPLLVAAMNGLTLSQPDIIAPDMSDGRTTDTRIQALEARLAEGQVFLEFEHIIKKKSMPDFSTALMAENIPRNRFKDVFPYEENRVRLTPTNENKTGYINSSHIVASVGTIQRFYIAAQGPLPNTLYSFWQMIWEHRVAVIVMLTEVQEDGQDKCFPYWPQEDSKTLQIGEFQIVRNFSMSSPTYITCSLTLCHITTNQQRSVWHIQYTDWPDHSCPEDVQGFIRFMSEVDAVRRLATTEDTAPVPESSPIVVHCSAGVGRSGVVILCDIMLYGLDHNQPIDVPKTLTQLRMQRMLTVQTLAQYKFVYIVLVQYLRSSRLI